MGTPVFVPTPPVGYKPPWEASAPSDVRPAGTRPSDDRRSDSRPADTRPPEKARRNRLSADERARRSRIGKAAPLCPLRPGEPCTLCQPFVTGPQDCQTVRLVMEDSDLREILAEKRRAYNQAKRAQRAQSAD